MWVEMLYTRHTPGRCAVEQCSGVIRVSKAELAECPEATRYHLPFTAPKLCGALVSACCMHHPPVAGGDGGVLRGDQVLIGGASGAELGLEGVLQGQPGLCLLGLGTPLQGVVVQLREALAAVLLHAQASEAPEVRMVSCARRECEPAGLPSRVGKEPSFTPLRAKLGTGAMLAGWRRRGCCRHAFCISSSLGAMNYDYRA